LKNAQQNEPCVGRCLILDGEHCAALKFNGCNDGIELYLREIDRALLTFGNLRSRFCPTAPRPPCRGLAVAGLTRTPVEMGAKNGERRSGEPPRRRYA
jgi:hypothetical protein